MSFELPVICDLLPVVKHLACEEISCIRVTRVAHQPSIPCILSAALNSEIVK